MNKRMRILIGSDGSSYADTAIDDLQRAGLPSNVEALVVSVGDAPIVPPFASHEVIERAFVGDRVVSIVDHANRQVSEVLKHANEVIVSASARLGSFFPGWQVRGEILAGCPAAELVRKANEWKAELLVVGSEGRSAIGRLILGSVSLEVATDAGCSVRIGRRGPAQPDRKELRILFGLDGSPGAERAIRKVLMRAWPARTELRVVAVDDGVSPIQSDVNWVSEMHVREDTSIAAGRIINVAEARGLSVTAAIKEGDPQRVLLAEAFEWEADCIVIGSRAPGDATAGSFAGSVSNGLAANAECSVEIVR
ncbi:MAG TPA: universal stress protein [Pyrinomonadaceae bacterium]|nr:universal stress protein [Pyrinomonadaceae bacterium]